MIAKIKIIAGMLRYLFPYWKAEAVIFALGGLGMIFGLLNPYIAKLVIDTAFKNRDLKAFLFLISLGGVIYIINGLIGGIRLY